MEQQCEKRSNVVLSKANKFFNVGLAALSENFMITV